MGLMSPMMDGAHATCRGDVVEVGGGGGLAVGATIGVVAASLGTGAGGGGSVGIDGTIGRCSGAGVGAVAVIVRELLSQSTEGVMMGTVGGARMSEGISLGGALGT
jgi:hypothetical protein